MLGGEEVPGPLSLAKAGGANQDQAAGSLFLGQLLLSPALQGRGLQPRAANILRLEDLGGLLGLHQVELDLLAIEQKGAGVPALNDLQCLLVGLVLLQGLGPAAWSFILAVSASGAAGPTTNGFGAMLHLLIGLRPALLLGAVGDGLLLGAPTGLQVG